MKVRFPQIELIIAGDFNRHDTLWGGTVVRDERRGEAEPILEVMENLFDQPPPFRYNNEET